MLRVLMLPHLQQFRSDESGIKRVVEAYFHHLPEFGIELVTDGMTYDVKVVHAGSSQGCDVSAIHGIYWTADYSAVNWEWAVNAQVIDNMRSAKYITAPSEWVAETVRRDMRRSPHVIGHGIDWDLWQEDPEENSGYVLWNKNRQSDVCDPTPAVMLAKAFPKVHFMNTFAPSTKPTNMSVTGLVAHYDMQRLVKAANVYLSTTKETFGIGTLEAMAAGVPVLGYANGGNLDLIQHGVNGYLAQPGSYEDLKEGLKYCLTHREALGSNGREMAQAFTWEKVCEKVAGVYRLAAQEPIESVTVVIPSYNYAHRIGRALASVQRQTFDNFECIVVDDGSTDESETKIPALLAKMNDERFRYVRQDNQGVAIARNRGISEGRNKYVCCLDADDAIAERFLEVCVVALESDRSLGIAYTGLWFIKPDGSEGVSPWPGHWDFSRQVERQNQVPTCCVFRRDMWEALGGYRSRYCPRGAGSEDAEFWTRSGAYGWAAKKVTEAPLFLYSWKSGRVSGDPQYNEPDWLIWHPWSRDGEHPFASYVKPKRWSHPVRQYDEPVVSVVIPVGPGHDVDVLNALDSLDAQTFRQWEIILVNDTGEALPVWLLKAFPHARIADTGGRRGAGMARNLGVGMARGAFLLFLDADDWLYPECIEKMLREWETSEACIYTDYVGKAFIEPEYAAKMMNDKRLLSYDRDSTSAVISHKAQDYDWQRAQRQPEGERPWIWCNITTLVPKLWHEEVGGFDEKMPSWEDVDYWYRMARLGKPFVRIPEQLMVYQFHSGNRRQEGYSNYKELAEYLQDKYKEVETMPCAGCGGRKSAPRVSTSRLQTTVSSPQMNDSDFVLAEYVSTKRNQHPVVGTAGFERRLEGLHVIRGRDNLWHIHYAFRAGGDRFLVHRNDIRLQPHVFSEVIHQEVPLKKREAPPPPEVIVPVEVEVEVNEIERPTVADIAKVVIIDTSDGIDEDEAKTVEEILAQHDTEMYGATYARLAGIESLDALVKSPKKGNGPLNLQTIPGVSPGVAAQLTEDGITTLEDVLGLGAEGLQKYKGIGETRAKSIWSAIMRMEADRVNAINATTD